MEPDECSYRLTPEKDFYPIGKMIHELDKLLFRDMLALGKKMGLDEMTMMNGWILKYLLMNEDKDIFQKNIETEFGITKSSVTGIIKLMEQKGFLERVGVPQDARLKKLVVTKKGREYNRMVDHHLLEHNREIRKNITQEELEIFLRVVDKIKKNVKE